MADLNIILQAQFQALPSSALKGYHSLTRAPRAQLWSRFVFAMAGAAAGDGYGHNCGPLHAQMLRVLLERALASYAEAQLVQYTFVMPTWLHGWAQKWGWGRAAMTVLALHAFAPGPDHQQHAVRVIYIPCFDL